MQSLPFKLEEVRGQFTQNGQKYILLSNGMRVNISDADQKLIWQKLEERAQNILKSDCIDPKCKFRKPK